MGLFNSFKSQIGRDTGKVFSNMVWGDKHASVYRRANSRSDSMNSSRSKSVSSRELEHESEMLDKLLAAKSFEKSQLASEKNINKIIALKIPQKKETIIELLQELTITYSVYPWQSTSEDESELANRYSDAILVKYELAVFTLKSKYPKEIEARYFENQLVILKEKRTKTERSANIYKTLSTISLIVLGVVLFAIIGFMAYQEKANKSNKPKPSISHFFKSIFD